MRISLHTPVMTPVYRATLAMFLLCALIILQFALYAFTPTIIPEMILYYLVIVPMGVAWSLHMQSDWAMGITMIIGIYALCLAVIELAFSRRKKFAWNSLLFLLFYLIAMPLMERFYGHLV